MILFANVLGNPVPKQEKPKLPHIDERIFRRIGDDDPEALKELYQSTHVVLYAFILSMVKNHEDALDLVQDTFIKIRTAAHLYKPMGKPLAWMFTIAKNLTRNKIRWYQRFVNPESLDFENDTKFSYVSDPEDRMVLTAAMDILSEEERQIVILHSVAGFKHRELAKNLDMPIATVLSKYHRALKKLRAELLIRGKHLEE
ncbi:RNA polymerase sigma factor [Alkalicella caledoniensis]|uniref:RNA polymerase sigma factor n=1 Tax=Alkalicella caledoniensis TaxID=2731377 RepID=A0A7G9W3M9_ALKCA|nr:RNA polymerase sigma factor [Alkalicella caledoniensis]QNO13291.1 RNA polymerase sigma factor [Alkalicella caledoniensis]